MSQHQPPHQGYPGPPQNMEQQHPSHGGETTGARPAGSHNIKKPMPLGFTAGGGLLVGVVAGLALISGGGDASEAQASKEAKGPVIAKATDGDLAPEGTKPAATSGADTTASGATASGTTASGTAASETTAPTTPAAETKPGTDPVTATEAGAAGNRPGGGYDASAGRNPGSADTRSCSRADIGRSGVQGHRAGRRRAGNDHPRRRSCARYFNRLHDRCGENQAARQAGRTSQRVSCVQKNS